MRIAISQPTYLPWLGYFDLIDQVDKFVFLDDVQFEKQSWQQRNRIKTPTGLSWLTVPVIFRGRLGQLIKDVEIRDRNFGRDHLRAIELNYRRTPYFDLYFPELSDRLRCGSSNLLVDLNCGSIRWLLDALGIRTPVLLSSELRQQGRRTELLANICKSLSGSQYVSPLGSAAYLLQEKEILLNQGIDTVFQHYTHPTYTQLFGPFAPQASVIDLLFNEGPRSLETIRLGRGSPWSAAEVAAVSMPAVTLSTA